MLEFQKECAKEGFSVNKILSSYMEDFLRTKADSRSQSNIDLFVNESNVIIMPRLEASKEQWREYWNSVTDVNEVARLEGLFYMRHEEAKTRLYYLKRLGNRTVNKTIAHYKY